MVCTLLRNIKNNVIIYLNIDSKKDMLKIKKVFIIIISFVFLLLTSFFFVSLENKQRSVSDELITEENVTPKGNDKEFEDQLDSMNDNQSNDQDYSSSNSVSAPPNSRPWELAEGKRD